VNNCNLCKDTGIYQPDDWEQPEEICTCVDAWVKAPERIVRDLGESGPFGEALRAALVDSLPKGAEWERHDNALVVPVVGWYYPSERASIATVIAAAKALTCLEK